jgi:hypothetical protein
VEEGGKEAKGGDRDSGHRRLLDGLALGMGERRVVVVDWARAHARAHDDGDALPLAPEVGRA